jgi:hypothetical protein
MLLNITPERGQPESSKGITMAYPCFVCGGETGPESLCEDCKEDLEERKIAFNGQWCPKHQIIHWRGKNCPMCELEYIEQERKV